MKYKILWVLLVTLGSYSWSSQLLYSTYLGGGYVEGIAVDTAGNAYITGWVLGGLPVTSNAFSTTQLGIPNVFVTKINPNLSGVSSLLYSTYLGGSGADGDGGYGIAVDGAGNVYITGYTFSTDFPVTANALQTVDKDMSGYSAFFSKLNLTATLSPMSVKEWELYFDPPFYEKIHDYPFLVLPEDAEKSFLDWKNRDNVIIVGKRGALEVY